MNGLIAVNALLMGLLALSFSHGPYSSAGQEAWYRYGSIGFFLIGAVLPLAVLLTLRKRHSAITGLVFVWLAVSLIAFLIYASMSGGGV